MNLTSIIDKTSGPLVLEKRHDYFILTFPRDTIVDWTSTTELIIDLFYRFLWSYSIDEDKTIGEYSSYLTMFGFVQPLLNTHLLTKELEFWGFLWKVISGQKSSNGSSSQIMDSYDLHSMIKGLTTFKFHKSTPINLKEFSESVLNVLSENLIYQTKMYPDLATLTKKHNAWISNKFLY
ncbi:hypothetical protein [Paenibacillus xylanilyticus]|uniref:Uncharacterized protein n=1 Tax=Paenibacillus xylanilyticus TaxID=248903 RepID=A0A7Y6BVC5_9BACL|nr:hypothetical protein [Paenibacillus xylanilyticus]NUU74629.1 hypothetical protein [Paenibacillus xylanilyticus]